MPEAITHFMWAYQPHFRIGIQTSLRSLLRALRLPEEADVFLVGVHAGGIEGSMPGCVEPEVNHWALSEWFYDAFEEAEQLAAKLPEANVIHTHPIAQDRAESRRLAKAIRRVVLGRLELSTSKPEATTLYASFPVLRDRHWIMIVIMLPTATVTSVPALPDGHVRIDEYEEYVVARSILEAAIESLFVSAVQNLLIPDASASSGSIQGADEILRRAGYRLARAMLEVQKQDHLVVGEGEALVDGIERISQTPYESTEAHGRLVVTSSNFDVANCELRFLLPVNIAETKPLRKLLSFADIQTPLVIQAKDEFGNRYVIGTARRKSLPLDTIEIVVAGRADWSISVAGKVLVRFRNSMPEVPAPEVDEARLANDLRRLLPGMSQMNAAQYAMIGSRLAEADHGALLIIVEDATTEAERLGRDGMRVEPIQIDSTAAEAYARIDGAILCDQNGLCHAIGVILDGLAVAEGDRGRGSRYNSALRYVHSVNVAVAAIICSEDGGLSLVPALMPRMSAREIHDRLQKLRVLAESPNDPPDYGEETDMVDWLEKHSYYLSAEQCEAVNAWVDICEKRRFKSTQFRIIRRPLQPSSKFVAARDLA